MKKSTANKSKKSFKQKVAKKVKTIQKKKTLKQKSEPTPVKVQPSKVISSKNLTQNKLERCPKVTVKQQDIRKKETQTDLPLSGNIPEDLVIFDYRFEYDRILRFQWTGRQQIIQNIILELQRELDRYNLQKFMLHITIERSLNVALMTEYESVPYFVALKEFCRQVDFESFTQKDVQHAFMLLAILVKEKFTFTENNMINQYLFKLILDHTNRNYIYSVDTYYKKFKDLPLSQGYSITNIETDWNKSSTDLNSQITTVEQAIGKLLSSLTLQDINMHLKKLMTQQQEKDFNQMIDEVLLYSKPYKKKGQPEVKSQDCLDYCKIGCWINDDVVERHRLQLQTADLEQTSNIMIDSHSLSESDIGSNIDFKGDLSNINVQKSVNQSPITRNESVLSKTYRISQDLVKQKKQQQVGIEIEEAFFKQKESCKDLYHHELRSIDANNKHSSMISQTNFNKCSSNISLQFVRQQSIQTFGNNCHVPSTPCFQSRQNSSISASNLFIPQLSLKQSSNINK